MIVAPRYESEINTTVSTMTTATDLIVDFPHHPRKSRSRAVHFAKTAQLHVFEREYVPRHELSYTRAEYDLMERVRREDVLKVRAAATAMKSRSRVATDDDISTIPSVCLMGIEHLLTPVCIREFRACRARCIRAVLAEQARQDRSPGSGWDSIAIALASCAQTKNATRRARQLGELHQDEENPSEYEKKNVLTARVDVFYH